MLVVVTASLQWGCISLSPSSSRPVRCSIDVTAAPSLRPWGHCGVPHSGIGPFAAVVALEHLGCGALGFVQSTCSCSTPALLLSAAIQPAPHNCSLPKPSSSGMACRRSARLSCCCCQEVCRGENPCEGPTPQLLYTHPAQVQGGCSELQGMGGAKARLHPQPSAGSGKPKPGAVKMGGSHPIRGLRTQAVPHHGSQIRSACDKISS